MMNTQNLSSLNTSCPLDTTDHVINKSRRVSQSLRPLQTMSKSKNHQAILHKESQSRREHIAALDAMDIVISAGIDLRITLWVILKQVTTLSDVEAATILLLDPHSLKLEQIISQSTSATRSVSAKLRQIYAQKAVLEKKPVQIPTQIALPYRRQQKIKHSTESRERFMSYLAIPLIIGNVVTGVLEVFKYTPCDEELVSLAYLSMQAEQAAIAIHNANLPQEFEQAHTELTRAYQLQNWAKAVERHEGQSVGYTEQMADLTVQLARQMGLSEPEQLYMRWGALLHDIGNMGVPEKLLTSPNPLSPQEWDAIRHHATYAYQMLDPISYLQRALDIPYSHHEKWDGTGYPRGLKGPEIPLAARIFAVIDVWTALRSKRPYRPAWSDLDAENYIREQAGKQFDPAVVDAFLKMLPEQRAD